MTFKAIIQHEHQNIQFLFRANARWVFTVFEVMALRGQP